MPDVSGRFDGRQIIVSVFVAPPSERGGAQLVAGRALLDTGASASLITSRFAITLDLPERGKHRLMTARGIDFVSRYQFRLGFELATSPNLGSSPYLVDRDLIGFEFTDHGNFDVIVGMDVLSAGDFHISRDRSFSFTFD